MALRHVARFKARYSKLDAKGEHRVVAFWLEETAAADFLRARDHLDTLMPGAQLVITDAGRTHAQQVALKKAKPGLAATPGKSWHEAGRAIDVDTGHLRDAVRAIVAYRKKVPPTDAAMAREVDAMETILERGGSQKAIEFYLGQFNFKRTVTRESWHFQWVGGSLRNVRDAISYIGNNA
jgi:hypothetical protein